jgi:hypothetical protein
MIELRASRPEELQIFCDMEQDADTQAYILAYSLQQHRHEFEKSDSGNTLMSHCIESR